MPQALDQEQDNITYMQRMVREQARAAHLYQLQKQAKIKGNTERKKKAKEAAKKNNLTRIARSRKLRIAWYLLIPSAGTSMSYIYMHIFGRLLFGNTFCKLGEEWMGLSKVMQTTMRILEIMLIAFLAIYTLILFILCIVIIGWIIANPIKSGIGIAAYLGIDALMSIYLPWY